LRGIAHFSKMWQVCQRDRQFFPGLESTPFSEVWRLYRGRRTFSRDQNFFGYVLTFSEGSQHFVRADNLFNCIRWSSTATAQLPDRNWL
jgi:hypothetical protein